MFIENNHLTHCFFFIYIIKCNIFNKNLKPHLNYKVGKCNLKIIQLTDKCMEILSSPNYGIKFRCTSEAIIFIIKTCIVQNKKRLSAMVSLILKYKVNTIFHISLYRVMSNFTYTNK